MALPTHYATGTATINAGETAVTGQGTAWLTNGLQAGDRFWAAGLSVRIAAVNSNTSLTLAYGWPGANRAAAAYEIRYTPDVTRVLASNLELLEELSSGNISSIAALASAADRLPYFTGSGTAALATLTAFARSLLDDADAAAMQATLGLSTFWNDANSPKVHANDGYQKLKSGTIIQWGRYASGVGDPTIIYPIAYPARCTTVVCAAEVSFGASSFYSVGVTGKTTTQFTGQQRFVQSGSISSATVPFNWMAVGY